MTAGRAIARRQEPRGALGALPCETVGVVVIGHDEGARLERALEAVNRMRYPEGLLEKIYVDSESTDGSAERAAEAGFAVLRYSAPFRTAAGARELGWRATRSRFVLFLDGDCELDPDFLRHAVSCALREQAAAVNGRVREARADESVQRRIFSLHWEINRTSSPGESYYAGGCALVERAALEEIGGFNVELAATENSDLGRRLGARGKRVWFLDRPMVLHDSGVQSWREVFRRCVRNGYWFERYSRLPNTETITSGPADARRSALRKAAPGLAVFAGGAVLAGVSGAVACGGVAAAASLWKRTAKVQRVKGGGWSSAGDGVLLGLYDWGVWIGQLRFLAERLLGAPGKLRTGPDWRTDTVRGRDGGR